MKQNTTGDNMINANELMAFLNDGCIVVDTRFVGQNGYPYYWRMWGNFKYVFCGDGWRPVCRIDKQFLIDELSDWDDEAIYFIGLV